MAAMNDYSSKLHETMWWMNNTASNSPQGSPYKGVVHHSQPWPSHYQEQDEKDEDMEEQNDEQEEDAIEYMFEKALTPSDVGKLNRLVIPKQHAEKYFPLSRLDSVEKGLLLSFEDESGKLWRFRYSYWNSSQSYVLTKGWSRYVKEKQLDAGDVVSFQRRRPDGQQLYIRWQRRAATLAAAAAAGPPPAVHDGRLCHSFLAPTSSTSSSSPGWSRVYYSAHPAYPSHQHHQHSTHGPLYHAAVQPLPQSPVKPGRRQVRLFGVNLNCDLDEPEPPSPEVSSSSNHDPAHFFSSHGFQQDYNSSQEYHNASYPGGGGDLSI